MLNLNNASQSVGPDGIRIEQTRLQPLREHELFGLPKSTGKPERPKLGPVRLKDLFGSPKSKTAKKTVQARRMTTMPVATSNTGKKLQHGQNTPVAVSATSAFSCNKTSGPSYLQGLSKSDGKINKTKGLGHERLKTETTKTMLKAWEASQTVQPSARKSRPAETRGQNVRRKLYSVFHSSPVAMPKNGRKSAAQNLPKSQKMEVAESKIVKPEVRRSIKPQIVSRKSCLPPPNSIRDKYINLRQNETIREESTLGITIEDESRNLEPDNFNEASGSPKVSGKRAETKNPDGREDKKAPEAVLRPTVIVGRSMKDIRREKDDDLDDIAPLPISRPPLQELHRDDNSRCDRGESFYCENLPRNSFLEFTISAKDSWVKMDPQTLSWIHENLKLHIRTSEEQLFTLRRVLKTIEDAIESQDSEEDRRTTSSVEKGSTSSPASVVETKTNGEPEAETVPEAETGPEIATDGKIASSEPEIPAVPEERKIGEDLVDEDKENRCESARRRSARLAEKSCKTPKSSDDSFAQFEHELNIVHASKKRNSNTALLAKSSKKLDPRSRKSIREYMALKSSINFLATPDVKGFPTPKGEKDTPLHRRVTRRSLSRKLLTELDELYADSPS